MNDTKKFIFKFINNVGEEKRAKVTAKTIDEAKVKFDSRYPEIKKFIEWYESK